MATVTDRVDETAGDSGGALSQWLRATEERRSVLYGLGLIAVAILVIYGVFFGGARPMWDAVVRLWTIANAGGNARVLRWVAAALPGAIILQHGIYLGSSRRRQFLQALGQIDDKTRKELDESYFGYLPLGARYAVPAIVVTSVCSLAIAALSAPGCYVPWLYVDHAAAAQKALGEVCDAARLPQMPMGQAGQVLSGAALGFIGAYVYMLILLTDRARQRDVTTGIAIWSAAMPILGPLMGGVAALLIVTGSDATTGSFTQYAVYFVAGMLPRQFALFVQSGVSKMFQTTPPATVRTLPLSTLRGVGTDVQSRLEEEGIFDVSALAYASPHQLMRTTTYSPRQIVDWIDESLLIVNMPTHWEALETLGVTGAMDLGWYETSPASIGALATEIKMPEPLLRNVITRLWQDAQVRDLYRLYWDHSGVPPTVATPAAQTQAPAVEPLAYDVTPGLSQDARDRLVAEVKGTDGVTSVAVAGDRLTVTTTAEARESIGAALQAKPELRPAATN